MREWVNAGDGERKVWVILVSEPKACSFDAKAEPRRVAVKWLPLGRRVEELELVEAQDALVDLSGLLARAYDFDHVTERRDDEHLDGLRKHRSPDDDAWLQFTPVHFAPPVRVLRVWSPKTAFNPRLVKSCPDEIWVTKREQSISN